MIKKFGLMLFATMSIVALSISQANASLNITINKLTSNTATVSFSVTGPNPGIPIDTLIKPVTSPVILVFDGVGAGNSGVLSGTTNTTITPGANFFDHNLSVATFNALAVGGNSFSLSGIGSLAAGAYGASSGVFTLTGNGIYSIANGFYTTNKQLFLSPFGVATTSFGRVNLTVTGVSAVPEPASMVYGSLVVGSMGLTYLRRRRAAKLA